MENGKLIGILRWIAVPVSAIAGMFVLYWIMSLLIGFSVTNIIIIPNFVSRFFIELFPGAGFVCCGSFTAPKHQGIVSIVLAVVFCCITLTNALLACYSDGFTYVDIIFMIVGCIGAIYSSYTIYNVEHSRK